MTTTILASLTGLNSDHTVLEAAVAMAKIDGGHIQCLHTRIDAVETAALIGSTAPRRHNNLQHVVQKISEQEEERSRHAKIAFEEAIKRHSLTLRDTPAQEVSISVSWKESETFLNETLDESRYHDLTIMARDEELSSERIISVIMRAGRPILLAPPKPVEVIGRKVAVAWKASMESAHAMTSAMPILSRAETVFILAVSEDKAGDDSDRNSAEHLARQLKWHGVSAQVRMEYSPAGPASTALKEMAYNCEADLLVMGAFGHSRVREFVFGSVTRDVLADSALPVLMCR
jgi:nucleotide-binding universal stress UspA family protein